MSGSKPPPRLRRAYFDCRYGQLHVHNAIPAGGGFDEATTLVCVHASGGSGRIFAAVLAALGADRSIYAIDLPGCGESDPAAQGTAAVDAGLHAVTDFLVSMRLRKVDMLCSGDGAAIALRLAVASPAQLRKIVLLGAPSGAVAQHPLLALDLDPAAAGLPAKLAAFLD